MVRGAKGTVYLSLKLAELVVLSLSVLVNLLLCFTAGVFDALGSVCGISSQVKLWSFVLVEGAKEWDEDGCRKFGGSSNRIV